jgi:hypothetical protein
MSELSILELETEHAELLPERETLSRRGGGISLHDVTFVTQIAYATASRGRHNLAIAANIVFIGAPTAP